MTGAAGLLARLQAHGVEVRADGDTLRYRPLEALTPALVAELARQKWAVLAHLAADEPAVIQRVEAMRARHPYVPGRALPFLTVRDVPRGTDGCLSCGEPVAGRTTGLAVRCAPCARAGQLVNDQYVSRKETAR